MVDVNKSSKIDSFGGFGWTVFFKVFEGEKHVRKDTMYYFFPCDVCQYDDLHSQHKAECGRKFKKKEVPLPGCLVGEDKVKKTTNLVYHKELLKVKCSKRTVMLINM